jgi:UDP-glucose 4-epimerase
MIALVTGAGGFIGTRLVTRLLAEGWEVRAVGRSPIPVSLANYRSLTWIVRDLSQESLLFREMEGVDTVFHLAGATLGAGKDERLFLATNEATTVRLLQAWPASVKRLVYASSQVVYGDVNHLAVSENFPLQGFDSAYSCSKVNAEHWLRWFQYRSGGSYVVLRFCGFVEGGGAIDYMVAQALRSEPIELFSNGLVCRDYLPIEKAGDALLAASRYSDADGFHPFNIGSGEAVASMELARIICAEVGSRSEVVPVDKPAPRSNFVFDVTKARTELGFEPGRLADAVRAYARARLIRSENGG